MGRVTSWIIARLGSIMSALGFACQEARRMNSTPAHEYHSAGVTTLTDWRILARSPAELHSTTINEGPASVDPVNGTLLAACEYLFNGARLAAAARARSVAPEPTVPCHLPPPPQSSPHHGAWVARRILKPWPSRRQNPTATDQV